MKDLSQFMFESINESDEKIKELEKKIDAAEEKADDAAEAAEKAEEKAEDAEKESQKAEESIKSEEDFRDYAKNKFEKVFGDKVDEKKMKDIVDGILDKYAEDAEKGEWGKLVGVLNKSFGH